MLLTTWKALPMINSVFISKMAEHVAFLIKSQLATWGGTDEWLFVSVSSQMLIIFVGTLEYSHALTYLFLFAAFIFFRQLGKLCSFQVTTEASIFNHFTKICEITCSFSLLNLSFDRWNSLVRSLVNFLLAMALKYSICF